MKERLMTTHLVCSEKKKNLEHINNEYIIVFQEIIMDERDQLNTLQQK